MERLEALEQAFSGSIRKSLDAALPEPDQALLFEIEKGLMSDTAGRAKWFVWIAILLGLTGLASAYYFSSDKKHDVVVPSTIHEVNGEEPKGARAPLQQPSPAETNANPRVIYRQEVINNE